MLTYDFKPACTYTDVFIEQSDGSYKMESLPLNLMWDDIKTAYYAPKGAAPQYVAVLPLWYPMSLESEYQGSIEVVVDRIEGLPDQYELVHVFPGLGVPHQLAFGDRDSQCALVLRQIAPVHRSHEVKVFFRIHSPGHLRFPERAIEFTLVGSNPTRTIRNRRRTSAHPGARARSRR